METDPELKKELSELITNFRKSVPVYGIKYLTSQHILDNAYHFASGFLEATLGPEVFPPEGDCIRIGPDDTDVDLPDGAQIPFSGGTRLRIHNKSGAMVIRRNIRPLDNIFGREYDLDHLKNLTIDVMKSLNLDKWDIDPNEVKFEHLWKIKASIISAETEVLCRVVGAFRRLIKEIPVYGRASIFVKVGANNIKDSAEIVRESAGIDWRMIEKEPVDEVEIIDPEDAAEKVLRDLAPSLPNKTITSKIFKPEFFSLGYFSFPRNQIQKFMQPVYVALFKSVSTSFNRGIVIPASNDTYEPLYHAPAGPPRTQRPLEDESELNRQY